MTLAALFTFTVARAAAVLPGDPLGWITAIAPDLRITDALLALVVLMILRGLLVPARRLEEARQDRDAWRAAHKEEQEAGRTRESLLAETMRSLDLVTRAWDAITPRPSTEEGVKHGTP